MKEVPANAFDRETSPTAASVSNRLYGPSGAMDYLVVLAMQGGAQNPVKVNAATGDEAAEKALSRNPGWKCAYVGPWTDAPPNLEAAAIAA